MLRAQQRAQPTRVSRRLRGEPPPFGRRSKYARIATEDDEPTEYWVHLRALEFSQSYGAQPAPRCQTMLLTSKKPQDQMNIKYVLQEAFSFVRPYVFPDMAGYVPIEGKWPFSLTTTLVDQSGRRLWENDTFENAGIKSTEHLSEDSAPIFDARTGAYIYVIWPGQSQRFGYHWEAMDWEVTGRPVTVSDIVRRMQELYQLPMGAKYRFKLNMACCRSDETGNLVYQTIASGRAANQTLLDVLQKVPKYEDFCDLEASTERLHLILSPDLSLSIFPSLHSVQHEAAVVEYVCGDDLLKACEEECRDCSLFDLTVQHKEFSAAALYLGVVRAMRQFVSTEKIAYPLRWDVSLFFSNLEEYLSMEKSDMKRIKHIVDSEPVWNRMPWANCQGNSQDDDTYKAMTATYNAYAIEAMLALIQTSQVLRKLRMSDDLIIRILRQ